MRLLPISQEMCRKLIHIGSSVIPLGYWLLGRKLALPILIVLTGLMIVLELLRMRTAWGQRLYNRFLGKVTRPEEDQKFTGATYVLAGALLAVVLFPPTIAIVPIRQN